MREISFSIDIGAPVSRVWEALVDPEQIPRWSYPQRVEECGESDRRWISEVGSVDLMEILEVDPERRLVCRWTSEEWEPTELEYRLEQAEGRTRLSFTNRGYLEGPPWDRLYSDSYRGWLGFHLELKRMIEDS